MTSFLTTAPVSTSVLLVGSGAPYVDCRCAVLTCSAGRFSCGGSGGAVAPHTPGVQVAATEFA